MKSAMTTILRDASGKMHHGILFDRRLRRYRNRRKHMMSREPFSHAHSFSAMIPIQEKRHSSKVMRQ